MRIWGPAYPAPGGSLGLAVGLSVVVSWSSRCKFAVRNHIRGAQDRGSRRHIHRHPTARVRSPSAHFSHPTGAIVSGGSSVCAFARAVSTESIRIPYTASLLCPERMDHK